MKGSDVTSALQLLATGGIGPIKGLANFNRQMGAIWEIFDLLGVQIETSGGFEVTETPAAAKFDMSFDAEKVNEKEGSYSVGLADSEARTAVCHAETQTTGVQTEGNVKKCVCTICGQEFKNRFAFKRHARVTHPKVMCRIKSSPV